MEQIKLTGIVTLDEKSMEELTEKIREDVILDIKENGNYGEEIEEYLNDCNYKTYLNMIKETIDKAIEKAEQDTKVLDSDKKAYRRLLAIKSVLEV